MDYPNILTNSGISIGLYISYKLAQRYYFRSGCHQNTLEITVIDRETEKDKTEEKQNPPEQIEITVQK
jgi:hypothetical protein